MIKMKALLISATQVLSVTQCVSCTILLHQIDNSERKTAKQLYTVPKFFRHFSKYLDNANKATRGHANLLLCEWKEKKKALQSSVLWNQQETMHMDEILHG